RRSGSHLEFVRRSHHGQQTDRKRAFHTPSFGRCKQIYLARVDQRNQITDCFCQINPRFPRSTATRKLLIPYHCDSEIFMTATLRSSISDTVNTLNKLLLQTHTPEAEARLRKLRRIYFA